MTTRPTRKRCQLPEALGLSPGLEVGDDGGDGGRGGCPGALAFFQGASGNFSGILNALGLG